MFILTRAKQQEIPIKKKKSLTRANSEALPATTYIFTRKLDSLVWRAPS